LLDEFAPVLAQIEDPRLRRLYAENFATLVGVDLKLVEQSVTRALAGSTHPATAIQPVSQPITKAAPEAVKIDLTKAPRTEVELLNVILSKEVYLQEALKADVADQLTHPGCKATFLRIAEVYRQMPNKFDTLSASWRMKLRQ